MRVLVCGSRDYWNTYRIFTVLNGLCLGYLELGGSEFIVIEGEAPGADSIAARWAEEASKTHPVGLQRFYADWEQYDKRAGYVRNARMLEEGKPDLVLAFFSSPERSRGTDMMVKLAEEAGVKVWEHTG